MARRQDLGYNRGMKKKIIFLCSANYYRSRYAEHYFNWLAAREKLAWEADSRGLKVGFWGNIGPIAQATVAALAEQGIHVGDPPRHPISLTHDDLAEADLVVAVKEAEHRAMMNEQFPHWEDHIEYWHIDDLDCVGPEEALPRLEQHVQALVHRLHAAEGRHATQKAG